MHSSAQSDSTARRRHSAPSRKFPKSSAGAPAGFTTETFEVFLPFLKRLLHTLALSHGPALRPLLQAFQSVISRGFRLLFPSGCGAGKGIPDAYRRGHSSQAANAPESAV